jgi:hypothetical protein
VSEELSPGEREELERLRREVSALRGPEGPRTQRWRGVVSAILLTVGCVLLPMSAFVVWAGNEVTDTERYVENVTPLASDPAIQNAVATRTTNAIMQALDLPALMKQAVTALESKGLPPRIGDRLEGLTGPATDGARSFIGDKVRDVVASDTFKDVWVRVNRLAHQQANAVLSGEGSQVLKVSGNTVTLQLGPIIERVKQKLVASGLGIAANIPPINPTIELFSSTELVKWQTAYDWLGTLKWALPALSLILIAIGVYVARSHRRALIGAGLGVAAGMLVLAVALLVVRTALLSHVAQRGFNQEVAADLFDTLVRFLKWGLRTLLVLGLVIAAAAFFTGPSVTAERTRTAAVRGIDATRGLLHLNTGRFGVWLHRNRTLVNAGVVIAAAAAFVFWERPTGMVVLLLAGIAVLLVAFVGLLARPSR